MRMRSRTFEYRIPDILERPDLGRLRTLLRLDMHHDAP